MTVTERPIDFRAQASADGEVLDLYCYDEIAWYAVSPRRFAQALAEHPKASQIRLFINSPGGSVFDAVAIYSLLARHQAVVNVFIDGLCASAATIITMAGDRIQMADNALFMIHNAWGMTIGTAEDHYRTAGVLQKVEATIIATYVARTSQKPEQLREWMDAETWFTAEEAKSAGFIDAVIPAKTKPADAANRFDLSHFHNLPESLKPAPAAPSPEPRTPSPAVAWHRALQESLQVAASLELPLPPNARRRHAAAKSDAELILKGLAAMGVSDLLNPFGAAQHANQQPNEGISSPHRSEPTEVDMDQRITKALRDLNLIEEGDNQAAAQAALRGFYAATGRELPADDVDQVLSDLAAEPAPYGATLEKRIGEARKTAAEEAIAAVAEEHAKNLKTAREDGEKAARQQAADTLSRLQMATGQGAQFDLAAAAKLVADGASVEQVKDSIIDALAAANKPVGAEGAGRKPAPPANPDEGFKAEYAENRQEFLRLGVSEDQYVASRRITAGLDTLS